MTGALPQNFCNGTVFSQVPSSRQRDDGCCEGGGGEDDLRTVVVSRRPASRVLGPAEHDQDATSPLQVMLVIFDRRLALLPTRDAGAYQRMR